MRSRYVLDADTSTIHIAFIGSDTALCGSNVVWHRVNGSVDCEACKAQAAVNERGSSDVLDVLNANENTNENTKIKKD